MAELDKQNSLGKGGRDEETQGKVLQKEENMNIQTE